ncbi:MAG: UDP-N-acetylmuramoyl-L-alanine--D-glutamate ligase, partial [Burkholderiales bacterium]
MDENELDPVDPRPADAADEAEAGSAERAAREAERQAGLARARAEALALARERATLAGRRVLVAGLGESGLAIARWAAARGASVFVADSRAAPPPHDALRTARPDARFVGGALAPARLDGVDLDGWCQGLSPRGGAAARLHGAAR